MTIASIPSMTTMAVVMASYTDATSAWDPPEENELVLCGVKLPFFIYETKIYDDQNIFCTLASWTKGRVFEIPDNFLTNLLTDS